MTDFLEDFDERFPTFFGDLVPEVDFEEQVWPLFEVRAPDFVKGMASLLGSWAFGPWAAPSKPHEEEELVDTEESSPPPPDGGSEPQI